MNDTESRILVSAEGLKKLEEELNYLETVRRPEIAEQIRIARDQLFQKLRPAALHILVFPAGIDGDALLVFVTVAGAPPELIRAVEGRFIPADADDLFLRLGRQRGWE